MAKKEKLEFILNQIRIMLLKRDYACAYVISQKIDPAQLVDEGLEHIKVNYNLFMIQYYLHEKEYLKAALAYKLIYDTMRMSYEAQAQFNLEKSSFANYILYMSLSPYSEEKNNFLNITYKYYKGELESDYTLYDLTKVFLSNEIQTPDPCALFMRVSMFEPFDFDNVNCNHHFALLQRAILQHNLKVTELYYKRITMKRLSELTEVEPKLLEEVLTQLIYDKQVHARIDRLTGIISFKGRMQEHDYMNTWRYNIKTLLRLVEETGDLINRECSIYS